MSHLSARLLTLCTVLAATACGGGDSSSNAANPSASGGSATAAATATTGYPALYRQLALPEIPGGVVGNAGRQSESLTDGLMITLTVDRTLDDVRKFYTDALTTAGWTPTPMPPGALLPNMPVAVVEFTKAAVSFRATLTATGPSTSIVINVVQGSE